MAILGYLDRAPEMSETDLFGEAWRRCTADVARVDRMPGQISEDGGTRLRVKRYALQDMSKPMALSEYAVLPPDLAKALPTPNVLEAGLEDHLGSIAVVDEHDDGDGGSGRVSKGP